ncbi:MAG: DUF4149 domain-containing protein [Blastocatellia bacterium]|nr:DUF4149 domain-containing protein [Blastocatellia bacterium]
MANGKSQIANVLDAACRLTLGTWLGSMLCFSALVAPSAFAVLPSRHMAGSIVNSVLGKLEWMGIGVGLLLIVLMVLTVIQTGNFRTILGKLAVSFPIVMAIDSAVSKWVISSKLSALRAAMVVIDNIPATDPRRIEFNDLHQYSVWLMGANLLLTVGLIVLHMQLTKVQKS